MGSLLGNGQNFLPQTFGVKSKGPGSGPVLLTVSSNSSSPWASSLRVTVPFSVLGPSVSKYFLLNARDLWERPVCAAEASVRGRQDHISWPAFSHSVSDFCLPELVEDGLGPVEHPDDVRKDGGHC